MYFADGISHSIFIYGTGGAEGGGRGTSDPEDFFFIALNLAVSERPHTGGYSLQKMVYTSLLLYIPVIS
jgi:hypothetical protein